jgi:cytidylate kinase
MEDRGLARAEAEQYIVKRDGDRKAFVRKYFNVDIADPSYYDMIINTEKVSVTAATESVIVSFHQRRKRNRSASQG